MVEARTVMPRRINVRKIELPVRTVEDRPIGTFSHDVESVRDNSFGIVRLAECGEVSLVSKARNYSITPYDVMVCSLDDHLSSLNDMTHTQVLEFFGLLGRVHEVLEGESGMKIAIALNQHQSGFNMPERLANGLKTRVQTLKPIHAHIYEVSSPVVESIKMGDLSKFDQRDMMDPFLVISSEFAAKDIGDALEALGTNATIRVSVEEPPFGVNVCLDRSMREFLIGGCTGVIGTIQKRLEFRYNFLLNLFAYSDKQDLHGLPVPKSKEQRLNNVLRYLNSEGQWLSVYSKKILKNLALRLLTTDKESRKGYIFLNGIATTYTFLPAEEGVVLNVHPRVMSSGNSPDSLGIYIQNTEGENETQLRTKRRLYKKILDYLQNYCQVTSGPFL